MAKKKSSTTARLMTSIEVAQEDGTSLMIPVSAEDNAIANKILASQMRALIQKHIAKIGGLDMVTPKELKELTEAAKNVAEFSGNVYKTGDNLDGGESKPKEENVTNTVAFDSLISPAKTEEPSKPTETPQ